MAAHIFTKTGQMNMQLILATTTRRIDSHTQHIVRDLSTILPGHQVAHQPGVAEIINATFRKQLRIFDTRDFDGRDQDKMVRITRVLNDAKSPGVAFRHINTVARRGVFGKRVIVQTKFVDNPPKRI
ncbi:hypothetical protein HMPREF0880_03890 [Yokenella regensburgei ATCC 43003]|nr:hypothetical protein HMPREF0880_03890 [Yokenella regensburgei ATCC 43003]